MVSPKTDRYAFESPAIPNNANREQLPIGPTGFKSKGVEWLLAQFARERTYYIYVGHCYGNGTGQNYRVSRWVVGDANKIIL